MNEAGAGVSGSRAKVRWSRVIGFGVGMALLAGAIVAVARAGGSFGEVIEPMGARSGVEIAAILAGMFGAILSGSFLTAGLLWVLTGRYGRVGYFEMWALINAAWLLNYLPVRPGMFGRLAYHRSVNRIRILDSAKALVWTNVLMLLGAVLCVVAVMMGVMAGNGGNHWAMIAASLSAIPVLGLFAAYAHKKRPEPDPEVWRMIAGLALGYAAQLAWAARFMLSFHLLGLEVSWGGALALAAVAAVAAFVPITGNGLGVREWVIGLAAPLLPVALVSAGNLSRQNSLTSVLVDRSVELVVAVPMGLICGWWVVRNAARVRGRGVADVSDASMMSELRDSLEAEKRAESGDPQAEDQSSDLDS